MTKFNVSLPLTRFETIIEAATKEEAFTKAIEELKAKGMGELLDDYYIDRVCGEEEFIKDNVTSEEEEEKKEEDEYGNRN